MNCECCQDNKYVGLKVRNAPGVFVIENTKGFKKDDIIAVQTERGKETCQVLMSCSEKLSSIGGESDFIKKIYDVLNEDDMKEYHSHLALESEALEVFREKVIKHELPMKVIEVYYMLDKTRIMFYYYAENKVDFRKLVRDLASVYKTRIEMRQVGIRDEAKIRGGLGPCGLVTCCKRFLYDFESISMKMAKDQEIMLNPSKISGICGRLMCCLKYEQDFYSGIKAKLLPIGATVVFEDKKGRVTHNNAMKNIFIVQFEDKETREFTADFLKDNLERFTITYENVDTGGDSE
jgi:cell fate regulator YaaT (PSP1 superfamily)